MLEVRIGFARRFSFKYFLLVVLTTGLILSQGRAIRVKAN